MLSFRPNYVSCIVQKILMSSIHQIHPQYFQYNHFITLSLFLSFLSVYFTFYEDIYPHKERKRYFDKQIDVTHYKRKNEWFLSGDAPLCPTDTSDILAWDRTEGGFKVVHYPLKLAHSPTGAREEGGGVYLNPQRQMTRIGMSSAPWAKSNSQVCSVHFLPQILEENSRNFILQFTLKPDN